MMKGFLEYVPGDSFLHRMNPVAKLGVALLLVVATFATGNFVLLALLAALDVVLAAQCKMLPQTLGLARAVALFSLLLALIALLFTPQGDVLVALPWGYIGTESVITAVLIVVRLVVCAVPLFLVFYVTKLTDMANALVKVLHVPYKYAFTFMSTVHFIPVFMNDMSGIMEAQTARGVEFDGGIAKKIRLHDAAAACRFWCRRCAKRTRPPSPPRCAASTCAPAKAASRNIPSPAWTTPPSRQQS